MRQRFNSFMVLGLSLALVAVVKADDKVPSHQPNDFTQIHLLQNSSVQKELKLSDALANKLREMFAENQEEIKEVWQKYPPDEAGTHWQGMTQELKKSALALLNDQQRHRLWQIDFQQSTSFGFDSSTYARPDIAKVLEWTDEQKTKLQEIQTDTANKNKEAIKTPQQYQQKIAEIRKQDREQVAALLTKEQQQKWQDFVGERFTITNPQVDLQSALSKWIRDDFSAAQARSRKTGKPILAVFRCEP